MYLDAYETVNKVVTIPLELIDANAAQPRTEFSDRALSALAESISQNGLLQPIVLRISPGNPDRYELICGERRMRAFKLLGEYDIPAIVTSAEDDESAVLALVENMSREPLGYFEEAAGIESLIKVYGMSQAEVGRKLCKAQSTVANKLRLLKIPEPARELLTKYSLTERHARALLPLADSPALSEAVRYIFQNNLNVAAAEKYVERLSEEKLPKLNRPIIIKDLRIFSNTIKKAIETMKEAGIPATGIVEENDSQITYTITIPKSATHISSEISKPPETKHTA